MCCQQVNSNLRTTAVPCPPPHHAQWHRYGEKGACAAQQVLFFVFRRRCGGCTWSQETWLSHSEVGFSAQQHPHFLWPHFQVRGGRHELLQTGSHPKACRPRVASLLHDSPLNSYVWSKGGTSKLLIMLSGICWVIEWFMRFRVLLFIFRKKRKFTRCKQRSRVTQEC